MQKIRLEGSKHLWIIVTLLLTASLLAVSSAIGNLAWVNRDGNTLYYIVKHGVILASGFGIIYAIHRIDILRFSKIAHLMIYVGIALLILTAVFGLDLNNAKRVLPLGFGLTFQASDVAKIGVVMYMARFMAFKQEILHDFKKGFLPLIIPVIITCAFIFPFNFSTAAMVFVIALVMMFIGRVKMKHIGILVGTAVLGITLMLLISKTMPETLPRISTWESRIESFFDSDDNEDDNYQALQSKIAIAAGWPVGKGFGNSTQRHFLPQSYNDFIFSTIVEQTGLWGTLLIIGLYISFYSQCYRIAGRTDKLFGKFLVLGIGFMIIFQALINMMVASGLLPVTGQPLPLVSMGGTSIWITCFAVGLILSVSRTTNNALKIKQKEGKNG